MSQKVSKYLVCVVVVGSLVAVVEPAAAIASPVWRLNGVEVSKATVVKTASKSGLFTDEPAGLSVSCGGEEGVGEARVGPGSVGEITKLTFLGCKFNKASSCESTKPVSVRVLNLPWSTELTGGGEKGVTEQITAHSGGGSPGYVIECTVFKVFTIKDECTSSASFSASLKNLSEGVRSSATVLKFTCSIGGAGTDIMLSTEELSSPVGLALTVE